MLTNSIGRLIDSLFLKLGRGDAIRADSIRSASISTLMHFMLLTYIPLFAAVTLLVLYQIGHSGPDNRAQANDIETGVKAFAVKCLNRFLADPTSADTRACFSANISVPAQPKVQGIPLSPGGHAIQASSALPNKAIGQFDTWSVLVDCELPKAANSATMLDAPMQVDVAIDPNSLMTMYTLPHPVRIRPSGQSVELATQTTVAPGRLVYTTAQGFLDAYLVGSGELAPFVAAGSPLLNVAKIPPFVSVKITSVLANSELANAADVPPKADGIEVTVRGTVLTPNGVSLPMEEPLIMSVAAGHWQVERINDSPTFVPPSDSTSATTTDTTSSSAAPTPTTTNGTQ